MATRDLSAQFSPIIESKREHGIELVPEMPGMMKIGGLHVPVASSDLMVWTDPGHPEYHEMSIDIPDEKGNIFNVYSGRNMDGSENFWGTVIDPGTRDHVHMEDADEFAKVYSEIGAADREDAVKYNGPELEREHAVRRYMGANRGEWTGATNTAAASMGGWEHHVFDPVTGDVRPAAMSKDAASQQWGRERKARGGTNPYEEL